MDPLLRFVSRVTLFGFAVGLFGLLSSSVPAQPGEVPMSREERIRQHRERVRQIINERRDQQQQREEAPADAPAMATPAGSGEVVPITAAGGPARPAPPPRAPHQDEAADMQTIPEGAGSVSASNIKVSNCMLYISPLDTIASVGERFATRVILDNPSALTVGRVSVVLRYDPRILRCLHVFDDQFRPYVVPPPVFEDDPLNGRIVYSGDLRRPQVLPQTTVLTLVWEALRTTDYAEIAFGFQDEGPTTVVTFNNTDILGTSFDPYDGVINASVLVRRPRTAAVQTDPLQVDRRDIIAFFQGFENPPGSIGLALAPPEKPVQVGDVFDVPIVFHNPDALSVDTVSLFIRFNSEALEVVDHDRGNWIRRGINIYDGDRHEEFPFDYLIRNEALNAVGTIEYRVGLQQPKALPSGYLATIRFRALAPSTGATVRFATSEKDRRSTSVTIHGEEALDLSSASSRRAIQFKIFP